MGLLEEIRDAALDELTSPASVLRRCLVLAYQLRHDPLKEWVHHELNGYPGGVPVPDYRVVHTTLSGNFINPRMHFQNHPVPMQVFSNEEQEFLTRAEVRDDVSTLDQLKDRTDLRWSLTPGFPAYVSSKLDNFTGCLDAWQIVPPGVIAGILGAVRNRLIEFTLSIEVDYPGIDQAAIAEQRIPHHDLDRRFNVFIQGQGHTIHLGSGSIAVQQVQQQVVAGNLGSLKAFLREQGVDEEDFAELDNLMEGSTPADLQDERSKVRRWVDKVADKAGRGSSELMRAAAREVILLTFRHYFGDVIGVPTGSPKA